MEYPTPRRRGAKKRREAYPSRTGQRRSARRLGALALDVIGPASGHDAFRGSGPVALLELLAAAAVAGVIAADGGRLVDEGLHRRLLAVDVVPRAVDLLEARTLAVGVGLAGELELGGELDH